MSCQVHLVHDKFGCTNKLNHQRAINTHSHRHPVKPSISGHCFAANSSTCGDVVHSMCMASAISYLYQSYTYRKNYTYKFGHIRHIGISTLLSGPTQSARAPLLHTHPCTTGSLHVQLLCVFVNVFVLPYNGWWAFWEAWCMDQPIPFTKSSLSS